MKKIIVALLLFIMGISPTIIAQTFVHPGVPFTAYDLAQLKANITKEPWLTGYNALKNDPKSQLTYGMQGPFATVTRAPNLNNAQWISDMQAIHNLTFMWVFTGDAAYAQKATDMLDAWAVTNTTWGGGENNLDIGDQVTYLVPAADILKSMFSGWTAANTTHVNNYFANVLYPTSWVPNPLRDHNKGALQLKIALSIAAFLDDPIKFNQAIEVYRMDAGGGLRNSLPNGEVADAGRDDHWNGQIQALGWGAEVAFKQGVDMFAELDNRMLAIGELYNHYSMYPGDLTYIPLGGYSTYYTTWGITPGYRHNELPLNNIIHTAYSLRKGIPTPYTDEMLTKDKPSALSFLYLKSSDPSTATALTPIVYPATLAQPVSYLSNMDIGNTGIIGNASYNAGTWTAQGAGNSAANAANYTFKPIKGDVGMVVRVMNNSISSATSGLMIRESLLPTSNYVSVNLSGGVVTSSAQGQTAQTNGTHYISKAPWWLKIERVGNRVFTYHSQDGVNWSNNALFIMTLPTDAYIGFYTISNNTSALNTATFTNVAINNTFPAGSPEINSATSDTVAIGAVFNYTITAANSPTSFSASGLPAGLTLDAATGVISGTPTALGTNVVTLGATNANGTETATLVITVINNVAPVVPASLTASIVNTTKIKLSWTASANATSYTVKRSLTAGGPYTSIQSGITATSFIDPNPVYEVNNYYVVTALTGEQESGISNEVSGSVPPEIPSNLIASSKSGQVDLSWNVAQGAQTYQVSRGTTSGGPYTAIATVSTNSYSDTNVTNGNPYYYVVASLGSTKQSANSAEVFGVPGSNSATWSPSPADSTWNLAANWVEGNVPATPAVITFNASADTVLNNNMTGLEVSRIQFNAGANAYKIAGNSIVLRNDLVNNSSRGDSLTMPLVLNSQLNVNANTNSVILSGIISGTGSLLKTGPSALYMSGANTYSGNTTINGTVGYKWGSMDGIIVSGDGTGTVGAPTAGPLGTGKIIMNGGSIISSFNGVATTLYNDIEVTAGKTSYMYERSGNLNIRGRLTGGGTLINDGSDNFSALNLYADNSSFTGTFVSKLRSGQMRVCFAVPEAGSANANWLLDANGIDCHPIRFTTGTLNFGSLSGRGYFRTDVNGTPLISIGALNTSTNFGGTFAETGTAVTSIEKVGTGTLTFSGNNNYKGNTTIKNGTFLLSNDAVSGVFVSPIVANAGALGGTGRSSATVTIGTGSGAGASFVPGTDGTIGRFTTTALVTLNSDATYKVDIDSNTGASDTIVANGITLNSAILSVAKLGTTALATGSKYRIVKNTSSSAVTGTFKNLPEFAIVTIDGIDFRITYRGGDGNDIELLDDRTITKVVPSSPANLLATGISSTSVNVKWPKSPSSEYVTSYTLKRSSTDGGPYTVVAANLNDTSYLDKNLAINTIYYYVVSATNYLGEGANSVQDSAKTLIPNIPPVPTGIISAAGDAKISLSWGAALEAVSYNIKRSSASGGPYTTVASNVTATSYTDNTVVNGTTYYYVISSVNIAGESANSVEVSVTPATGGYSYWPFNETSGVTANDVWGARNATLNGTGATWTTGVSGNGLHLDGTATGYATLPSGIVSTLTGDFTVSAWVKLDALQNNQRIFDFGTSSTNYMFLSQNTATTMRYAIKVGSGTEQGVTSGTLSLSTGKWVHVAVTLSGSTHTLYVNGAVVATSTGITFRPSGLGSTTLNYFGKSQFSADPLLKGSLDDIRIYNRALSASEVSSVVSATAPASTVLTGNSVANQPSLTWTASSQATGYNVKRATVAGGPYIVVASNISATAYTDATATFGSYYYVVTSVAGAFEGVPSNEVSVVLLPAIPTSPIATGWNNRTDISWTATSGATSYDINRATVSGGPYTVVANVLSAATLFYNDAMAANGTTYYYVISAKNAAGSVNSTEVSVTPVSDPVANVWSHQDIGSNGVAGNGGLVAGTYSLWASGADIWSNADAFQFLYQPFNSDGAIVARVLNIQNTNTSAKAGIMMRETLTAGSRHCLLGYRPSSSVEFVRRLTTGGSSTSEAVTSLTSPQWVKLLRIGTSFTSYRSVDGITWTQAGTTQTISMATSMYVGLAYTSHVNTTLGKAQFDHVNIAVAVPVITSATTGAGTVGMPFTYTIAATNTPYLYSATGLPAGLTLNADNGVISGTPTDTGTFPVNVSVVNAMGTATATLTLSVSAGTSTWNGTGSWGATSNWSSGMLPLSGSNVIVQSGTLNIDQSVNIKDLIMEPSANVSIATGNSLTTTGNLTLKSDATGTASLINNGTLTVSGISSAQRYMTGGKWHIVSPIAGAEGVATFVQDAGNAIPVNGANYAMMDYDEQGNAWNAYFTASTSGSLVSGKGYCVRRSSDGVATFTGALTSGNLTASLTQNGYGWNCIGNPYPSSININDGSSSFLTVNASNLDANYGAVYLWDEQADYTGNRSDYKVISNAGFSFPSDRVLLQNYITSGQGFFVKAASAGLVNFTPAMQSHQNGIMLKASRVSWPAIRLNVTAGGNTASTVIAFNSAMTKGLDPTYDAGLLRGTSGLSLYSHLVNDNGTDFAIQCLPDNLYNSLSIPLGIDSKNGGDLTFSAESVELPVDCNVTLEDKVTGTFTSLSAGNTYTSTVAPGTTGTGRFYLHAVSNSTATSIPGLLAGQDDQVVKAYGIRKTIYIKGNLNEASVVLYNLNGKSLKIYKLSGNGSSTLNENSVASGSYIIRIVNEGKEYSFKVVLMD
ncbi:MAG: LamG-like jellyroll fold domain-containing protein [Bacteroidota bacterium]|nr:LamG-like jellyroll fold domain-containing protein [Bacteroidota bacterium]